MLPGGVRPPERGVCACRPVSRPDFSGMPKTAFIVRVARTAAGKRNGLLSRHHPCELGALSVDALLDGFDPSLVDDVIFGCVTQVGTQSANVGRGVVLNSQHLPLSVPGTTVDRQCGSSQQAIHFASQAVMSGTQDVVVAGGVETMSTVSPMLWGRCACASAWARV